MFTLMKILYITNLFGIIGNSAAVRNSALINGLAGNGHIVDVLTIKYPNNRISSTLRSCSYNAIFETELGVMDVVQGIANVRKNISDSLLRRIKKNIRELFFFPDIYVSWAEKINPNEFGHYDLLISSSDYKSSHYVAKKIKQVSPSLRWIQIWGDPWSIDSMLSRLTKLRAKRHEKRLLSMADKVVYVSELTSKAIIDMYPYLADKIHYVPRSYFKEIIVSNENRKRFVYDIVYAGGLSAERQFDEFLDCVRLYNETHLEHFNVHFYGNYLDRDLERMKKYSFVFSHSTVDYDAILDVYAKSDALLFISNGEKSTQIPGKFFDYLGTNLPIICLVKANSDLIQFVSTFPKCLIFKNDFLNIAEKVQNGKFTVDTKFSPEMIAKEILL